MKRIRTIAVLALAWLGPVVCADELGWKTADPPKPPVPGESVDIPVSAPTIPISPSLPKSDPPWKTAAPVELPPVKLANPTPLPEPNTGGLEPLTPAVLPPTTPGPIGPRNIGETKLPPLPLPILPVPGESLPAPRPLPISPQPQLNPQPICNDTPSVPMPAASLTRVTAVTPAEAGVPLRGHVLGSEPVRISQDFLYRDLFGLNLFTGHRRPIVKPVEAGSPDDSFFVQVEYLLWFASRPNVPTLATTNTLGQPGFLGQPGTRNLFGPGQFGPSFRDGFRIRGGGYWDDCGQRGFDASFFFLGRRSNSAGFDSAQYPVITRPIFAPNFNSEFGELVAQPNVSTGRLDISADTFLWGADLNYRRALCRTCDRSYGWFAGYRNLNLYDTLTISESIVSTGPQSPDPIGTRVFVQDQFKTRNHFHGGQVGGFWNRRAGRFDLDVRGSVALGATFQTVEIDGFQQRTRPGAPPENFRGGLLATGPNLGSFSQSHFSVVPEFTTAIGYRITPNLSFTVGYNVLFWTNVIRPGDQIDRVVDVALVPNPPAGVIPTANPRPQPTFRQTDFWAHGVTLGLQYRW